MDNHFDKDSMVLIVVAVIATVALKWYYLRRGLALTYVPSCTRDAEQNNYLSRIIHGSEEASISMLRMKRAVFLRLCDLLKSKWLLRNTLHMTVEGQVAMFLHILGHNMRNRVIGVNFLRSSEIISRYFKHILHVVGELRGEFIQQPQTTTSPIIAHDPRFMPYFKDCIGALDGTYIHTSVPNDIVACFRGRKPYPTQNVLVAVDFELRLAYVLPGWEGSAHDALVLSNALEREDGLSVPEGKYYLVDAGYSIRPGFISPFRGVRYHLKEFSVRSPMNNKELFNYRHSSLRTTVERAFGSMKNRFKILTFRLFFSFEIQVDIVIACCILHNYILCGGHDIYILDHEEREPNIQEYRTQSQAREDAREWVAIRDVIMEAMQNNSR